MVNGALLLEESLSLSLSLSLALINATATVAWKICGYIYILSVRMIYLIPFQFQMHVDSFVGVPCVIPIIWSKGKYIYKFVTEGLQLWLF
jgi:hypothetical protein